MVIMHTGELCHQKATFCWLPSVVLLFSVHGNQMDLLDLNNVFVCFSKGRGYFTLRMITERMFTNGAEVGNHFIGF